MSVESALRYCGLTDQHFEAIARAVPAGYAAVAKLASDIPMFGRFVPGFTQLGRIKSIAVQYALQSEAASTKLFYTRDRPNTARNFWCLELQVERVLLTSHFSGDRSSRSVRKALYRAELARRNEDLFGKQGLKPDFCSESRSAYAQIVHGGVRGAEHILIRIPNLNQVCHSLVEMSVAPIVPSTVAVEEVADQLHQQFTPRRKTDRDVG